ncbi:MAG: hypothetical protein M1831_005543 [Alyxoria varia]|nr:MAG: hypothetical protein M1831_005543 [Alyxoria varia]
MPPRSSPLSVLSRRDFRDISDLAAMDAIPQVLHRRSSAHSTSSPERAHGQQPALAALQPLSSFNTLEKRQQQQQRLVFIPDFYRDTTSSPAPGVVVGATLGAVIGFLFLVWLVQFIMNSKKSGAIEGDESEVVAVRRERSHSPRRRHHRKHRSRRVRSEVSQVSSHHTPPPPPRSPPRRRSERMIVEETRRTERSQPPPPVPPPMSPEMHRERESTYLEETERRVAGDDVVEVIEEHSSVSAPSAPSEPPKRKKSGYRTVDPNAYAGGNYPQQDVSRERRRSKR